MKQAVLLLVALGLVSTTLLFSGTPQVASFTSPLPTLPQPPPVAPTYPPCPDRCTYGCIWYVRPLVCYWPPEAKDKDNEITSPTPTAMQMPAGTRAPFYSRRDRFIRH